MSFEDELAKLNAFFFFREFTFSSNQFKPAPQIELELADAVIWLDDFLIVAQIKERNAPASTTSEREEKWFNDTVVRAATRQIRNTLGYLKTYDSIEVHNDQGHQFNLAQAKVKCIHKVVIYDSDALLPQRCASKKFHTSRTAGAIHIIRSDDYLDILKTLITPSEINEYLSFRETVIKTWGSVVSEVSEEALLGQYLRNLPNERPSVGFLKHLAALEQRAEEWDISRIITLFAERRTTSVKSPTDYYRILTELAKMNRTDMRLFKERFKLSMEKATSDEFVAPYRFTASTECGFLFIPLKRSQMGERLKILTALTELNKYDLKLSRCVGLTFVSEGKETWCDVQWCRLEFPWLEDSKITALLKNSYPFRLLTEKRIERYGISDLVD
jgi:hypothetical protein